jgi:hypothetical protein
MEQMLAIDKVLILGLKENIHALKDFHIHNYKVSSIKFFYLNKF